MDELKQTKQVSFVSWPSPQDYNECVQNPHHCFADTALASGTAETDALGLPRPNTGMFASVYRMQCPGGDWALRCFLHFVPDQVERYTAIHKELVQQKLGSILPFDLQQRGVLVKGQWFPIQKMQWCNGKTLDRWIFAHLYERETLNQFLKQWRDLLRSFRQAGIAHGDLQHGNILINEGEIKVVDYDGMYVPALNGKLSNELGHRGYQHPARRQEHFGAYLDNFSAWLIYYSVQILSTDPSVWHKLKGGEDCLLLRGKDFEDPEHSPAFFLLENHVSADVREASRSLRYLLSLPPEKIPPLDEPIIIPHGLPQLKPLSQLPSWIEDQEEGEESHDQSSSGCLEEASYSPLSQGRKRPRSRAKGGAQWRRTLPPEPEPPKEPVELSPLAKLARSVQHRKSGSFQPEQKTSVDLTAYDPANNSSSANELPPAIKNQLDDLLNHKMQNPASEGLISRIINWCLQHLVVTIVVLGIVLTIIFLETIMQIQNTCGFMSNH